MYSFIFLVEPIFEVAKITRLSDFGIIFTDITLAVMPATE
jgi:hypothetical protein